MTVAEQSVRTPATTLATAHRRIFGDIYEWAGQIRTAAIAKDSPFRLPQYIETASADIFRALRESDLKAFGACLGVCDDLLSFLPRSGTDRLSLTLCVSDRLVCCLLRDLQDLGRLIHVVSLAGLESRHLHLLQPGNLS